MNILYKKLPNGVNMDIVAKFLEIKEELLEERKDLLNRYEYFTRKHRGNRLNDINVGIFHEPGNKFMAQIFLQNKQGYIKNQITFDGNFRLLNDNLKINLNG